MSEQRTDLTFWAEDLDDRERGRRMVEAAKIVWNLPSEIRRRQLDVVNIRMYDGATSSIIDVDGMLMAGGFTVRDRSDDSVYNKARAAINTLASQIATTDQRARFVTVGEDYRGHLRARKAQTFVDGLVHELKLHKLRKRAWYDAAVTESGIGVLQFFRDGDKVRVQRLLPTQLCWDPADGFIDGKPQTIYVKHALPRVYVRAKFGGDDAILGVETVAAIDSARSMSNVLGQVPSDQIEVWECFRLPTTPESGDGFHVIALDVPDGILHVAEYKTSRLAMFAIEERMVTAWGNSLMSQAYQQQRQIDVGIYRIERLKQLYSAGMLYIDRAARIAKSKLTNEYGLIVEGNGPTPPQRVVFQAATAEMYQDVERAGQRLYEVLAVNPSAAQGQSDRGLDASAAAMREETAKTDRRNSDRQQNWEQFLLDCIECALGVVREIADDEPSDKKKAKKSYTVRAPGKGRLTSADWREIALARDEYTLEILPANPIPTTPAGLIALGKEMVELEAWDGDDVARYMQSLDAEAKTDLESAERDDIEQTFERLLYEPKGAAVPDEFTPYQLAIKLGAQYLAQAKRDGVPEKHLERARRYIRRCKQLLARTQQAAQPQPPPVPADALAAQPAPDQ